MLKTLIVPIALLAAACSPPASQEPAKADAGMNMETPAGAITSTGTVTQVDAAAGAITINHEPIAALSWPAMTMQFTVENPAILEGIAAGDHVSFEIKSATETSIVSMVQRQ